MSPSTVPWRALNYFGLGPLPPLGEGIPHGPLLSRGKSVRLSYLNLSLSDQERTKRVLHLVMTSSCGEVLHESWVRAEGLRGIGEARPRDLSLEAGCGLREAIGPREPDSS